MIAINITDRSPQVMREFLYLQEKGELILKSTTPLDSNWYPAHIKELGSYVCIGAVAPVEYPIVIHVYDSEASGITEYGKKLGVTSTLTVVTSEEEKLPEELQGKSSLFDFMMKVAGIDTELSSLLTLLEVNRDAPDKLQALVGIVKLNLQQQKKKIDELMAMSVDVTLELDRRQIGE